MNSDTASPADVTADRTVASPDHKVFFHWLPWALPMAAIAIPEVILVIIGTGKYRYFTIYLAVRSVNRGDLLIPVIIICAEAFRRWWETEFHKTATAAIVCICALLSGGCAVIAVAAYTLVLTNPPSPGWADIANGFTWVPLAFGLIGGTIAVKQTVPQKAEA